MLSAIIVYSLSINVPTGYVEIKSSICKKAYGVNLDGFLTKPNGEKILIKAHCYKKDVS